MKQDIVLESMPSCSYCGEILNSEHMPHTKRELLMYQRGFDKGLLSNDVKKREKNLFRSAFFEGRRSAFVEEWELPFEDWYDKRVEE